MTHGLLADIAENGIGPSEGHDRRLGEEDADIHENVIPAAPEADQQKRQEPEQEAERADLESTKPAIRHPGFEVIPILRHRDGCRSSGQALIQHIADDAGRKDDRRKRDIKEIYRDERQGGERHQRFILERLFADADHRFRNNGRDGGFEAEEKRGNRGNGPQRNIDPAQTPEDEDGREYEKNARGERPPRPMEKPADVGRKLLRLRAGQEHAEIQGVKEVVFGHPLLILHHFLVHHGDLTGRTAEADEPEFEPVTQGLTEADLFACHARSPCFLFTKSF